MTKPVPSFQKGSSGKQAGRSNRGKYVSPRQVEHHWNFYKKGIYIARPSSGLPGWFLPLIALVLIVVLVFWGVPAAISRLQNHQQNPTGEENPENKLIYDDRTQVVNRPIADIFDQPDLKAARVTQALYNEPVTIRANSQTGAAGATGFAPVALADGTTGFIMTRDLTARRTSIEPGLYRYKLVIATATKRIMSHTSQGTLLVEVMMGTVLYADYRGDGISRVGLPDGTTGWISDEGVIVLPVDGAIETPDDAARYFCSTALAFRQVTVIENGQSIRGVSTTGIARLAAMINGLSVPRTLAGLSEMGSQILVPRDQATGLIDLTALQPGDLLFLAAEPVPTTGADEEGSEETESTTTESTVTDPDPYDEIVDPTASPVALAIYVDTNQILFARPIHSAIQLLDLSRQEDLQQRIVLIRRLFD